MDLVERYLQAVRFWLPRELQDDLVAELSEDLLCQVEEAEAGLGRPLDREETAALLRRTGKPIQVAARYLDQSPLLDPALAMIFRLVVKIVLLWVLLPLTVVTAVPSALLSEHPLAALSGAIISYGWSAIVALGCITLVFTLIGGTWSGRPWRQPAEWNPLALPPLRKPGDGKPIPRSKSLFEILFGLLFAGWWMEASTRVPMAWSSLTGPLWSAGPVWEDFHGHWYVPVLALALANVAVAAVSLAKPHWFRFRLAWGILSNALTGSMCLATFAAHRPAVMAGLHATRTLPHADALGPLMDQTVALALLIMTVSCFATALVQAVRLAKAARR